MGRNVLPVLVKGLNTGENSIILNVDELLPGIYYLTIGNGDESSANKLMISK